MADNLTIRSCGRSVRVTELQLERAAWEPEPARLHPTAPTAGVESVAPVEEARAAAHQLEREAAEDLAAAWGDDPREGWPGASSVAETSEAVLSSAVEEAMAKLTALTTLNLA